MKCVFSLCNLCCGVVVNNHLQSLINNQQSKKTTTIFLDNHKCIYFQVLKDLLLFIYEAFCHVVFMQSITHTNQHSHDTIWPDDAASSRQYSPVWSSPAGWGIVCWLICFRAPPPGFAWCRWLGWPGWSRCRGRGRRRRLPPAPARGGGAAVAAGPIERGRGKGREGRSAWRCAWQLGHDPAL